MAKRKINYELLNKVKNRLKRMRHPEHFNMGTFGSKTDCGTTACIAGHACLIAGVMTPKELFEGDPYGRSSIIERKAKEVLGLTWDQSNALFFTSYWPDEFGFAYTNANADDAARRDIAVKRIEHFIQTQGKE